MKLYQPVMFVGLGGTGCDIGAELERRMREEICGPDGNDFRRRRGREGMLPYQLPSCVQFVYADMNQAELDRLPRRVVPGPEHIPVASLSASYANGLVPDVASYPELARNLRLEAERVVAGWLPPATQDEPRVNPLHRGAGQFPTIGRAALFGTFMESINPAVRDIREAIGRLSNSGADLDAMGGKPPKGVDVFVAFSVAGGTGCGIFYDYLHLIAYMLRQNSQLRVKIYPLVLMPSAFEDGLGGGRAAELNAGRALLDLFRLVDQQNGADAERELHSAHDQAMLDPDEVMVYYPGDLRIVMRPGTLQTGFLFSQPAGATRQDMHRSIVSLMMSLAGTEMAEDDDPSVDHHQSFADSFVNQATHRQVRADNGIGNRGVSTALVASLTVPVDDLAGIVGSRLLRTAVDQLSSPQTRVDSTRSDMEDFLIKAGVHPVLRRHGSDFAEPEPAHRAREVTAALNDRREAMRAGIDSLKAQLGRNVPQLVQGFDPDGAARELLGQTDVFDLQRVVFGHPELNGEVEQAGVHGMLHRRRAAPEAPAGHGIAPPPTPELRDRFFRKVQWNDEDPVAARGKQDEWYKWQTQVSWAEFWSRHTPQWRRPLDRLQRDLTALTRSLLDFARQDEEDFNRRSAELYRKRVGVSYLLPAGAGRMEQFYQQVVRRMLEHYAREGRLSVNSTESQLVGTLIGTSGWRDTYEMSIAQSPENALSFLREQVKTEVKRFLREPPPGEQPMLPRLQDLLAAAAGHGSGPGIMQDYLDEFRGKLAGLVPANFTPQGSGPLKVLIAYPADAPSEIIKGHLINSINLPTGPRVTYDYRNTHTESISVVLFRTAMGVTEVEEVRDVLRLWAGSLARPEPTDLLRWRQRTGYDFGYLATREEHRVEILHRLLCALWNGRAAIQGPKESPDRVNVEMGGGVVMSLPLTPLGQASSWGSLVRAYELWALDDDDIHRRFCAQLMRELPVGIDGRPKLPDKLCPYMVIRDLAEGQVELLDDMIEKQPAGQSSRAAQMRAFWVVTLPAALNQQFTGRESPVAPNLRELERVADAGASG
jgi:Tubulin like